MSIFGLIIGGAAGLIALRGPLGALLNSTVGRGGRGDSDDESADDAAVDGVVLDKAGSRLATKRIAFTIAAIALGAKMAKADGIVTRDEVDAFKQVFHIPPEEMD